ncbi:MAG: cytochrome P460 family protein [Inquilinus sp.]|nr:cytochrome P460 family protein [Inquilinus sp.]
MRIRSLLFAAVAAMLPATSWAGPERVDFPAGYRDAFVEYLRVDRPDRKTTRFFYVDPESLAAAEPGRELPQGTVLIMEDHKVVMNGDKPALNAEGRHRPTDEVTNVFVMEKRPGWGAEYPLETRNGDWDYAWFEADGSRKQGDFVRFTGCFSCHMNRANRDFTFTFFKYLLDTKG